MQTKSFFTKTRWLVTIILLFSFGIGQIWGTVTGTFTLKNTGQTSPVTNNSVTFTYNSQIITGTNNGSGFKDKSESGDAIMTVTIPTGAILKSISKGNGNSWGGSANIKVYTGTNTSGTLIATIVSGTNSYSITSNNTGSSYYFINNTGANAWINSLSIEYYPQTVVTLDKNGGDTGGTAKFSYGATGNSYFSEATRAGYTCTGYWTTASGSGTKVLNTDGSFATSSVSGWYSSGKWNRDDASGTLYARWESAASCAADVAIGTASLNGTFNLSSVGVQCASITVGSNCAVAANNYGFIWYEGTGNKEIGGSGVTRVNNSGAYSSGTFSNTLSSTFVAGTTYTFRAFAINDKPSTAYSAAVSFTPYTVTFNMNGHGSAPTTQVVNTGGTASTPSAPSATGYTFGGWYQEAGCTNSWNFSTTITSGNTTDGNRNLYAKWTAKEYTVTLDNESPTVSGSTSVTLTYNSASHAAISNPTKTGYTFAGWWTADNGTGTEVINTSGVLQANVSNYTGAGGIWTRDNNSTTLYAKWTAKSFTVTWMVNGVAYTTGDPSGSVDFGTHVAKLPTAPTPPCGNKFMGWTTTNIGSVGIDKANTSAITALNLFTAAGDAPTISAEGNVTYYAVFADYAE